MLINVNLMKNWTARLVDRADCGGAIMFRSKRDISYRVMQQADIARLGWITAYLLVKDGAVICNSIGPSSVEVGCRRDTGLSRD